MAKTKFKLTITGVDQVVNSLEMVLKKEEDAARKTLDVVGTMVFDLSQTLVPVDTGALKLSGRKSSPRKVRAQDAFYSTISYGGGSVDYAATVHERLDYYHEPPTSAKYLERPLRFVMGKFLDIATGEMKL